MRWTALLVLPLLIGCGPSGGGGGGGFSFPIGGQFGFSMTHSPAADARLSGYGFFSPPIDYPGGTAAFVSHAALPLGSCHATSHTIIQIGALYDGGSSLTVAGSGSAGTFALADDPGDGFPFYNGDTVASAFAGAANWTLSGTGGATVDSFDTTFAGPDDLTSVTPSLETMLAASVSSDLQLSWSSSGNSGDVYVSLDQKLDPTTTSSLVYQECRFADTGSAAIPSAIMTLFDTDDALDNSIEVKKEVRSTFSLPEESGEVLLGFESIWRGEVDFQ